jgi:FKBP-type peptidyl-prolyl cis-trans isomerase (trigger factor)
MKTEVKVIDNTKREISVEVSGDVVKNKFEDVFKRIGQEAKVKGFRPGHVPQDILEKNYSSLAHEQVMRELIPEVYGQALDKENLGAIDLPQISDVKLDRNLLSFKALVEIMPEIAVNKYKGLRIEYQQGQVNADEIKRNIDSIKESRKAQTLDDNFAKSLGYPGLTELEKVMERQLLAQKDNQQRQKIENQVIEQLTKELDFKLPDSLVKKQHEDLLRQTKIDLAIKGVPKEKIEEQEKKIAQDLEPEAKKQVKIYMILAAIAKKENITVDDHMPQKVMELLFREADWKIS